MVTQIMNPRYSDRDTFVDEPSYFAQDRKMAFKGAVVEADASKVVVDTGRMRLTYHADGHPFSAANLQVDISKGAGSVRWTPGLASKGNLGGTETTLDQWKGARKLSDGLLSRDGWYCLDDSKRAILASDWVKARPAGARVDWYLFGYGDDFKLALRSLTALGGAIPMPRRYALGAWYSRYWAYSSADYRSIVKEYAEHDFPLDVIVMDMDWHLAGWTGFSWNRKLLPDAEELLEWFHKQGLAVTLNDHPADGVKSHESSYPAFMKAMGADASSGAVIPFDAGSKAYMDAFWETTHVPLNKAGVDFWWLDWQQYYATRSLPSLSNLAWLNHYYYERTQEQGRRGLSFSRWAGWGDHRHPIHFSGDASTSFEMLAFEVPFTATAGNVGCFFWSHDIGGHMGPRNEESYTRWCQFGAFSPALRSHSSRNRLLDRRPWTYPAWAEQSMKVSFQLRSRFFPYTYSAVRQSCVESLPLVRPLYLDYPGEEAAYHQPQQYLYGDHLLVAPVTEPGVGTNRIGRQVVWFPAGDTWFNFFTGEAFKGGREVLVAAAIDEFPLYVRGGTPLPMRPFSQRMATAPLTELVVRCYPGEDGRVGATTLYEDDGLSIGYSRGEFAETSLRYVRHGDEVSVTVSPASGTFAGQPDARSVVLEFPATLPASLVKGEAATVEYIASDAMNRVRVPVQSIRKECTITVKMAAIPNGALKQRAFAQRAGLPLPAGHTAWENLLGGALDSCPAGRGRVALLAAAGIGDFMKNENVYGYPESGVSRRYASEEIDAAIEPGPAGVQGLATSSSQVRVGNRKFLLY